VGESHIDTQGGTFPTDSTCDRDCLAGVANGSQDFDIHLPSVEGNRETLCDSSLSF